MAEGQASPDAEAVASRAKAEDAAAHPGWMVAALLACLLSLLGASWCLCGVDEYAGQAWAIGAALLAFLAGWLGGIFWRGW